LLLSVGLVLQAWAVTAASGADGILTILDTASPSRCFIMGATAQMKKDSGEIEPYVASSDGGKAAKGEFKCTGAPAEKWREAEFDDGDWAMVRQFAGTGVPVGGHPLTLICSRSRFEVRDPATAGELSLTVSFVGGAVAFLNGRELGRAFLPQGELKPETSAEPYGADSYLDPDGFLLRNGWADPGKYAERFKTRIRKLEVKIPASALRKGINVLAIEVHRALTPELVFRSKVRQYERFWANWNPCGLGPYRIEELYMPCGITLTAPAGAAVTPAGAKPAGLRAWNRPALQKVGAADAGDNCEPLQPVRLCGARNGSFSGQVVIGAPSALKELRVVASELKGEQGAIPAANVQVRYAGFEPSHNCFDVLNPEAPTEVVPDAGGSVVQPVWFTVQVPRAAAAGRYQGKLIVSAAGAEPIEVPVALTVAAWELPDPQQFATHVGLIQSPDSVAMRYGVPMWSEEHWKLLEKSFALMGQTGSDVVYLPLLRHTHFGNEHGMVRWIRQAPSAGSGQAGGGWTTDLSIAERYLDLAVKHLRKPSVVSVYCWEVYTGCVWAFGGKGEGRGKGLGFTALDPKTGKLEEAVGPEWGSTEIRPFLKPALDGIQELLKKRGVADAMMVGLAGDSRPSKMAVEDLHALLPDAKWELHTHPLVMKLYEQPVGYLCTVWGAPRLPDPKTGQRKYGWKNPFLWTAFPREGIGEPGPLNETATLVRYQVILETMLASGGRGIGRVGADFWPVVKDNQGRFRRTLVGRFPDSGGGGSLGIDCSDVALLAPGRDGAVSTVRYELLRAGAQECEARIAIEKVLTDPAARAQLDPKLAAACEEALDARVDAIRNGGGNGWLWFAASGWQERSARLFDLAGRVTAAAAGGTPAR
jgi:hypothetical protein